MNGMIVDGLGHVSLDSSSTGPAGQVNNPLSQANIHQGKTHTFCWLKNQPLAFKMINFEGKTHVN